MSKSAMSPRGDQSEGDGIRAPRGRRSARARVWMWAGWSTMAVGVALLAAGLLFGVAASNANDTSVLELNLTDVVGQQQVDVEELSDQVSLLKKQKEALLARVEGGASEESKVVEQRQGASGPGVTVVLDDAPVQFELDSGTNVNETIVHQQDVDAVMNALWRGGAEFMSVQGVRITSRTPVRCIGNVILVGARSYAPPYRIEAVGDVEGMLEALNNDPMVGIYRDAAARYNLGWEVIVGQDMKIPAADAPADLQFAKNDEEPM